LSGSTHRVERTPADAETAGAGRAWRGEPPRDRYPFLTTTVPKEFVHRAAVAEVMLTGWQREDDAHYRITAQWPRGHSFFTPIGGSHYDPLMTAETIRQVGSLLAHAEFDVPLDHHFLMWDLDFSVDPEHLRIDDVPATLDIEVTCTEIKRRGRHLTGLRYEAVLRRQGRTAATGSASYTCTTPAVYQRLRAQQGAGERPPLPLTAPASPQSVGRMSPIDVVLTPIGEPFRWQLRVDTRHPVLFDHPVDHVPGMVLVEAARQAAAAALGRSVFLPTGITSEFMRYAELDSPCPIEARRVDGPEDEERVVVTGHQDGQPVFRSTVLFRPPAC
jgi:2-oxo-3-(phosphooxy)propyl 3-oxoalkanoate synthase